MAVPNAMENVRISEQSISVQPQPVVVRKELCTLPMDHSPVTLPGRCELSVTPLIKPLTPRTFPSTVISPLVTANPVTVVSISPKGTSHPLVSSNAVLIPPQTAISASHTKQPSVTIIKTENCQKPSLTALDVLNDTIVKSFDSNNVINGSNMKREHSDVIGSESPLNLIKNSITYRNQDDGSKSGLPNVLKQSHLQFGKNVQNYPNTMSQTDIKPIGNIATKSNLLSKSQQESVVIKCEPDFSIVECKSPNERKLNGKHSNVVTETRPRAYSSGHAQSYPSSIASKIYSVPFSTNDVNKKYPSNITTDMTISNSSILPNATGSFSNQEKMQYDHLNKGNLDN